ncbi:glycosyltransferase [Lacinutrix sp. MedPE-SW]|uniref:glycosyltransferase n=1 Tax=Lacinutrix sp. MedPE-SW TaxID=1860087 RepID=UPI000AE2843E|nr:glycosyltransferase [Lacinutrix sp. MedPE-SW]
MKIGIIIIFHNNEDDIDTKYFIDKISQTKHLELCFVNNESRDSTYQLLEEIKYQCSNVSIVNIKKFKSDVSAVRAGARYMFSQYDLENWVTLQPIC